MFSPIVYVLRTIHVAVGLVLSASLGYLYYVILTGAAITRSVWGAMAALVAEGIVFFAHGKDCPISIWQRRLGDEKGLVELFLPRKVARVVLPFMLIVSVVAFLLIGGRAFL